MKQNKVLIICADLRIGGAQTVAANISKYADDSFHLTYMVFGDEIGDYEAEIQSRGHCVVHWSSPSANIPGFVCKLIRFMKQEKFAVVHCHTMFNCGLVMLAAKIAGVPGRISHSHTTKEERKETLFRAAYRRLMCVLIRRCGNAYWACGVEAGNVLYSKDWFQARGVVIQNGIDFEKYAFSAENRRMIRQQYDLEDRFVIGHTGHYVPVKNQAYLIALMPRIRSLCTGAILLLFGDGSDRSMLEEKIRQYNVADCVRLMGNVSNIDQVLSAFDVFAFPSLFEGTPLALIEAQANGLPCVISDAIPEDACLTEQITALPLTAEPDVWAGKILSACRPQCDCTEMLSGKYADVRTSVEQIYFGYKEFI